MKTFKANFIRCQDQDGVVMVGFADDEFNTTEYLLLQRTLEPDQQDCELGHDAIHVELDSPERSGYGGVKLIRLDGSTVRVELNEKIGRELGASAIEVELSASDAELAALKEHLSLLVGKEPILKV